MPISFPLIRCVFSLILWDFLKSDNCWLNVRKFEQRQECETAVKNAFYYYLFHASRWRFLNFRENKCLPFLLASLQFLMPQDKTLGVAASFETKLTFWKNHRKFPRRFEMRRDFLITLYIFWRVDAFVLINTGSVMKCENGVAFWGLVISCVFRIWTHNV